MSSFHSLVTFGHIWMVILGGIPAINKRMSNSVFPVSSYILLLWWIFFILLLTHLCLGRCKFLTWCHCSLPHQMKRRHQEFRPLGWKLRSSPGQVLAWRHSQPHPQLYRRGLVINSILLCWLFTIKDRCKKCVFNNQGWHQLLLTVSWDHRA